MVTFQDFTSALRAVKAPEADLRVYEARQELHLIDSEGIGLVTVDLYSYPTGLMADVTLYRHGQYVKSFFLTPMKSEERRDLGAQKVAKAFTWVMK